MAGDPSNDRGAGGIRLRTMELLTALFFVAVGAVVITDSVRAGARWGDDGPQAGYFPFYIGSIMAVAGAIIAAQALRGWRGEGRDASFVTGEQLRLVMAMLLPTIAYVIAVIFLGIYVSSALFIGGFMVWQGGYRPYKAAIVALAVPAVLFLLFDVWFLVSLPKGPIERALGF